MMTQITAKFGFDLDALRTYWEATAPRLNNAEMRAAFSDYASGTNLLFKSPLEESTQGRISNPHLLGYRASYIKNCGPFKPWFTANIPNSDILDTHLGFAYTRFLQDEAVRRQKAVSLWTVGNSEGVTARTVAQLGGGLVYTVNNTETRANAISFYQKNPPSNAFLLEEAFFKLSSEWMNTQNPGIPEKFTLIHENCSLQMYGPDRLAQIAYLADLLEENGILILFQKNNHPDINEYVKREAIKDEFRARYIKTEGIQSDNADIIKIMRKGQVTLDELAKETSKIFPHIVQIWNSCNFNVVIASRSPERLKKLCELYSPPFIEPQFRFDNLETPRKLCGLEDIDLAYGDLHACA